MPVSPLRLRLDGAALVANWRALAKLSGRAACGAAIKADGYGLGAVEVARRLAATGCRDFFVATWAEATVLAPLGLVPAVLHGVRDEDLAVAATSPAVGRPVLNSAGQVGRWKAAGGAVCDVMLDTGMNRLGVSARDIASGLLDELKIDTLMSHLACADGTDADARAMNTAQNAALTAAAGRVTARRTSIANSAGIALGPDYHRDLTRPGLALYGGVPCSSLAGAIGQVVAPEAQILQRRRIEPGESIGYGATFVAGEATEVAIVNIGYADGYLRAFAAGGAAYVRGTRLAVLGRVSMDLLAIDVGAAPELDEGDWVAIEYALPQAATVSGLSQYELLTGLGQRFDRTWG